MTRPGPGAPREGGINGGRAVILIVVLVVLAIAVLARSGGHSTVATQASASHPTTTTTPTTTHTTPTSTTPTTVLPASQVKLQVLNGVLTGSLAGAWTNKLKANPGYATQPPDNATAKVSSSEIYVLTPGYQPEAQALAATVGLPSSAVNSTVPPPSSAPIPAAERATANLVLIIGPDLASGG